jgi:UDP-N-acetylglucosamine 2-epimerase (non-hydrolysing)
MINKSRVLFVFGTRPEAIKMAPLILQFKKSNFFEVSVCVTAQHREMLDQVLDFFEIKPDFDLNLMKPNQTLYNLTSDVLLGMEKIFEIFRPDYVFVHGDTTTSMSCALASFYYKVKICHVEAGLRTYNKYSPFPEEINRQLTSRLSDFHFTPTIDSANNLISEGISENIISIVGNTVIDALLFAVGKIENYKSIELDNLRKVIDPSKRVILVTGHRRENFGDSFIKVCNAILEISKRDDVQIVYPVHLNPNIQKPVYDILGNRKNITLMDPLSYPCFIWLMKRSYLILTDSGGIQEEAPSLMKPVLVMRNTTERPEALKNGNIKLVGTDEDLIKKECFKILDDPIYYNSFSLNPNPYGNGDSSIQILEFLKKNK